MGVIQSLLLKVAKPMQMRIIKLNYKLKIKRYLVVLFTSISFIATFSIGPVKAHSGRTDSSGGHNCYVGACAGTYHYHNGGSYTAPYSPPKPLYKPTPTFPQMTASNTFEQLSSNTFNVNITLNDNSPSRYSAVLTKCKGCDPGPKVDFVSPIFKFTKINPGTWYLNVKKEINGQWSTISYWTIDVPVWIDPSPTPKPTINPSPTLLTSPTATPSSKSAIMPSPITFLSSETKSFQIGNFFSELFKKLSSIFH